MQSVNLLNVKNLSVGFKYESSIVDAVHSISFKVDQGKIVGLVGESGCGKSLTALSIMGLTRRKKTISQTGEILFNEQNLVSISEDQFRKIRGNEISMIFQEPLTSLNPVFSIGNQLNEALKIHKKITGAEAEARSIELLKLVKIPEPVKRMKEYPHQLSGGMRQRVMIAMALACNPKLLIADEPTTALDVSIQAQILKLILELRDKIGMGVLLITHDLGVVAQVCDVVHVMYGGTIVESGSTEDVLFNPKHPYTLGLIHSMPRIGARQKKLQPLQGQVPALGKFPEGCKFRNRCSLAIEKCKTEPSLGSGAHKTACWVKQ